MRGPMPAQVARAAVLWFVHRLGIDAARADVDWHGPPMFDGLKGETVDAGHEWIAFGERLAAVDETPSACSPSALAYVYWCGYRAQKSAVDAEAPDRERHAALARPPAVPSRGELATVASEIKRTDGTPAWARFASITLGIYTSACEGEARAPRPHFSRRP